MYKLVQHLFVVFEKAKQDRELEKLLEQQQRGRTAVSRATKNLLTQAAVEYREVCAQ